MWGFSGFGTTYLHNDLHELQPFLSCPNPPLLHTQGSMILVSQVHITVTQVKIKQMPPSDDISKVKESCNRPGVAQRVPGGLGFQIS